MTVVQGDPEYLFTYSELDPGEEVVITYSVDSTVDDDVIDSFAGEVYAQELTEPPSCSEGAKR